MTEFSFSTRVSDECGHMLPGPSLDAVWLITFSMRTGSWDHPGRLLMPDVNWAWRRTKWLTRTDPLPECQIMTLYFAASCQKSTFNPEVCKVMSHSYLLQTADRFSLLLLWSFFPFVCRLPGCPRGLLVDWSGKGQVCWTAAASWANISTDTFLQDPP